MDAHADAEETPAARIAAFMIRRGMLSGSKNAACGGKNNRGEYTR
jgi:hypothetical protein